MGDNVSIKSSDDLAVLEFAVLRRYIDTEVPNPNVMDFSAKIARSAFSGMVEASTYIVGCPAVLFVDMAKNWKGWDGEKRWNDLEERLSLSATSDSLGHITVRISMRDGAFFQNRLTVSLTSDSGRLEILAQQIHSLFTQKVEF